MAGSSETTYGTVAVGATAVLIKAERLRRESIIVQNVHASQILYLGGDASVATTTGLRLIAGDSVRLETKGAVYGIASGAATDTRYFEEF
jgi:hypothetical protein